MKASLQYSFSVGECFLKIVVGGYFALDSPEVSCSLSRTDKDGF